MLNEDYIIRVINQVLALFLQAVGFKKAGKLKDALRVFDQAGSEAIQPAHLAEALQYRLSLMEN